ncbi:MAG TPA: nicotinate phosphoribosyltransferase [Candidatus Woesebacteria bacterium]|nr:nicotinate phosphoribosyltransferase [Candidatus Woesebacteria bacterium]
MGNKYPQIINSLLDNDLYGFTMGMAALIKIPKVITEDKLIIRKDIAFPEGFAEELRAQINLMANLSLSEDQAAFLRRRCGHYLTEEYIAWLHTYQFDPHEVEVTQHNKRLEVRIKGRFCRTVYWETPIMALISELYYKMTGQEPDPNYILRAKEKGLRLRKASAYFSEFGARRRFSYEVEKCVLRALIESARLTSEGGVLNGASNVQLCMDFDINPMGTNAHKWYQTWMGLLGIRMANKKALETWIEVFDTRLGIALTDTFTTNDFLKCFDRHTAMLYDGVRNDSEEYKVYTDKIVAHYKFLAIDPLSKTILFSDSLNVSLVEEIVAYCKGKIKCAFGIGTNLSNDIVGVEPLQIVIKQIAVYLPDGRRVWTVKISDNPAKASGDPTALAHAKYEIGLADTIETKSSELIDRMKAAFADAMVGIKIDGQEYSVRIADIADKMTLVEK